MSAPPSVVLPLALLTLSLGACGETADPGSQSPTGDGSTPSNTQINSETMVPGTPTPSAVNETTPPVPDTETEGPGATSTAPTTAPPTSTAQGTPSAAGATLTNPQPTQSSGPSTQATPTQGSASPSPTPLGGTPSLDEASESPGQATPTSKEATAPSSEPSSPQETPSPGITPSPTAFIGEEGDPLVRLYQDQPGQYVQGQPGPNDSQKSEPATHGTPPPGANGPPLHDDTPTEETPPLDGSTFAPEPTADPNDTPPPPPDGGGENGNPPQGYLFEFLVADNDGKHAYLGGQGGLISVSLEEGKAVQMVDYNIAIPRITTLTIEDKKLFAMWDDKFIVYELNDDGSIDEPLFNTGLTTSSAGFIDVADDVMFVPIPALGLMAYNVNEEALSEANIQELNLLGNDVLQAPTAIKVRGDLAYLADGSGGMKIIDVSDPTDLTILKTVAFPGVAQDIELGDDVAYVALGTYGVAAVDISDTQTASLIGVYDSHGSVFGLDYEDNHLFLAAWSAIEVMNVEDPANPQLVTMETPGYSAFDITVNGSMVALSDWYGVAGYQFYPERRAPEIYTASSILRFARGEPGDTVYAAITFSNESDQPLEIGSISAQPAERFSTQTQSLSIDPWSRKTIEVAYAVDEQTLFNGNLFVQSNDPDESELVLTLSYGGDYLNLGDEAPPFTLEGLDGELHSLSDQQDTIVLLAYFATW